MLLIADLRARWVRKSGPDDDPCGAVEQNEWKGPTCNYHCLTKEGSQRAVAAVAVISHPASKVAR